MSLERERVDRERRSVVVDVKWCYDVVCVLRERVDRERRSVVTVVKW